MKKILSSLEEYKMTCTEEAWVYFKKRENIPKNKDRLDFELNDKNETLKERWGAFRHVYTSAAFTKKYGSQVAKTLGDLNELKQLGSVKYLTDKNGYKPGNEPQDRRMDLKNNEVGRNIALKNSGVNLLDEVYYALDNDKNIVLNQYINNEKPYKDSNPILNNIWKYADYGYNLNKKIKKGAPTGYAANIEEKADEDFEPEVEKLSFRDKLLKAREERLAYYTARLAEDPEKIKEREAKHVSLEELKAPQEAKKQKVRDIIEGKVQFDENQDISAYENKKLGSNKIFTQEEIDSMSDEDKQKNKEAIFYQKQTIGVPTEEQAKKAVSKGGMVYVNGYTRSDGTQVKSYYRSR